MENSEKNELREKVEAMMEIVRNILVQAENDEIPIEETPSECKKALDNFLSQGITEAEKALFIGQHFVVNKEENHKKMLIGVDITDRVEKATD